MPYDRELEIKKLTAALEKSFCQWGHLYQNGGSDPFWADGINLNLVRNHIISAKRALENLMVQEQQEYSLFPSSYPDIYYRKTPDRVSDDFMAKADEIRERAVEQLALYEADPNFQYCLENHSKVFPNGETRATKNAGLSIYASGGLTRYRDCLESGDLVAMRRDFYEPYESKAKRWAEAAGKLRAYLAMEHRPEELIVVFDDDIGDEVDCFEDEQNDVCNRGETAAEKNRLSLKDQIQLAEQERTSKLQEKTAPREEQLSLF